MFGEAKLSDPSEPMNGFVDRTRTESYTTYIVALVKVLYSRSSSRIRPLGVHSP